MGGGNNVCIPVIECFAERVYHCVSNIAAEARVHIVIFIVSRKGS